MSEAFLDKGKPKNYFKIPFWVPLSASFTINLSGSLGITTLGTVSSAIMHTYTPDGVGGYAWYDPEIYSTLFDFTSIPTGVLVVNQSNSCMCMNVISYANAIDITSNDTSRTLYTRLWLSQSKKYPEGFELTIEQQRYNTPSFGQTVRMSLLGVMCIDLYDDRIST